LLAALVTAGFAGSLWAGASEDLFLKTHKGAKEADVAKKWYEKLPTWVNSLTSKNNFPVTHLPYELVCRSRPRGTGRDRPWTPPE
jgi:hypothetical protein